MSFLAVWYCTVTNVLSSPRRQIPTSLMRSHHPYVEGNTQSLTNKVSCTSSTDREGHSITTTQSVSILPSASTAELSAPRDGPSESSLVVENRAQSLTAEELTRQHRGTFFSICVALCNDYSPFRRRLHRNRHTSRRGPPRNIRFLSVRRWRRRDMADVGTRVPKVAIHRVCIATSPELAGRMHE